MAQVSVWRMDDTRELRNTETSWEADMGPGERRHDGLDSSRGGRSVEERHIQEYPGDKP